MKKMLLIIGLLFGLECHAETLKLGTYQDDTGVITVTNGGNSVDPYFATKALLLARDGGLNINVAGRKWIQWALAHQLDNGLFGRYCRTSAGADWQYCEKADAEDALLAVWLELLYALAPEKGLPKAWKTSAIKAQQQLQSLHQVKAGIYHISNELPVGLLMDNVEIYAAFKAMNKSMQRVGSHTFAIEMQQRAELLHHAIIKQFWNADSKIFEVSTQHRKETAFYPDVVAQIFPLLYALPLPDGMTADEKFKVWIAHHKEAWLEHISQDFPWGLVAVAAITFDDRNTAFCWQTKALPFRYGPKWNVLEEAALQRVTHYLKKHPPTVAVACMEKSL